MKAFFRFMAKRHLLAMQFTILVLLLGGATALRIQRDIFPAVDLGEVIITTRYPGASPEDVELEVTNKLEEELRGVAGLESIVSWSMEGFSAIRVTIGPDASDPDEIKDEIREAVDQVVALPPQVTQRPLIEELTTGEIPILEVGVTGDVPYRTLRAAARRVEDELQRTDGVAELEDFWLRDREVKVQVDPAAMREYEVSLSQVAGAVAARNRRATGGSFTSRQNERSVVTRAEYPSPIDVSETIVRATLTGPIVRLGQVASVEDGFEEPRIIARVNGEPAITFQVKKMPSADVLRTVERIRERIGALQPDLPEGVSIVFANDQSFYVERRFDVVLNNGAIGLVLVLLILGTLLYFRAAIWVAISIPVVLLGLVFLLNALGYYLDIITLAAMLVVLGIIVDDGIIVSESIVRQRERGQDALEAAASGVTRVFTPVVTTLITTFLAFAPLFLMTGIVGDFVKMVPRVVGLALFVSLLEIVIALPGHLAFSLKRVQPKGREDASGSGKFGRLRQLYERLLDRILAWRYAYVLLSMGLLTGTLAYAVRHMDFILFPGSTAEAFTVYVDTPRGSPLEHTSRKVREVERLISGLPESELESVTTRIGSHGPQEPGENDHWAFLRVDLTPFADRSRRATTIADSLREAFAELQGFSDIDVRVQAGGPPVGEPITIRVVGEGDSTRVRLTDELMAFLRGQPGVEELQRNDLEGEEQLEIDLDFERLARRGLTVADVTQTVRTAYDGRVVSTVRYGDEDVGFLVTLAEDAARSPDQLLDLRVPNRAGRLIRLGDVAELTQRQAPSTFYHYDGQRAALVTGEVDEDVTTPVKVAAAARAHFQLEADYPGMRFVIGGEAEETRESFQSLFLAFGVAVLAIYFTLMLLFSSITQPLAVMAAVPFGVIAVILTFVIHGQAPGFLALMGLVGLSGVVVNDSLVMVYHINNLRSSEGMASVREAVTRGAGDRLRAVMMTTLTTVAGLLPLAYGLGGSDPFIAPMALALGYGLLLATPLTLALVPCLYLIHEDIAGRIRSWLASRGDES